MIAAKIVKEQYERMTDEALVRFTVNESHKITSESFQLLRTELIIRNLDLSILETLQTEKELKEANKLSEFEKSTALGFIETVWQFAFDEKEIGKSDEEIYKALLRKNISDQYAQMIIFSLEQKAKDLVDSLKSDILIGWLLTIGGALLLLFTLNVEEIRVIFLIWSSIMLVGGIGRLAENNAKMRKFQTIINNIEAENDFQNKLYQ